MAHEIFDDLIRKYNTRIEKCNKQDYAQIREIVDELDSELTLNDYELPLPFISDFLVATFHLVEELKPEGVEFDQISNDAKLTCMGLYTSGITF